MSSENEMTVLEMGDAESISLTDLLYLVQGDGADRDRKMTLTQLRDFIAEKFNTVKITGSVGGGAALGPTYATFASNSSTAQLTTLSLDFSLSDGSRSAYIGTDEFKITNANIGVTEIKADGITTPKVTISGADVYLKVSEQNVLGVYYDYTDEETGSTVTVELATFGATTKVASLNADSVSATTVTGNQVTIPGAFNATSSSVTVMQPANFTGTEVHTGTATFNGELVCTGGAQISKTTTTEADTDKLLVNKSLVQYPSKVLSNTSRTSFFKTTEDVNLTALTAFDVGSRVVIYNDGGDASINITWRPNTNADVLPPYYAEEFICVAQTGSLAYFAPIRNSNS